MLEEEWTWNPKRVFVGKHFRWVQHGVVLLLITYLTCSCRYVECATRLVPDSFLRHGIQWTKFGEVCLRWSVIHQKGNIWIFIIRIQQNSNSITFSNVRSQRIAYRRVNAVLLLSSNMKDPWYFLKWTHRLETKEGSCYTFKSWASFCTVCVHKLASTAPLRDLYSVLDDSTTFCPFMDTGILQAHIQ